MEEAAKAIAAFYPAVRGWGHIGWSAVRPLPEALVRPGLVYVLLLISHDRRRLLHFNVTAHPNAPGSGARRSRLRCGASTPAT
jgi:hypothetical protein